MPEPKSDQRILSEMAAFGHEHEDHAVSSHISYNPKIAAQEIPSGGSLLLKDELAYRPQEYEVTSQEYVDYLRSMPAETRADVIFLADKMEAFETTFADPVRAWLDRADKEGENHPDYLGHGSNARVFKLTLDGYDYAIKTNGSFHNARPFRLADKIAGVSHLVAIDIVNNITVMDIVPGKRIEDMSIEERLAIPDEHIKAVIDKTLEMHEKGLAIDPKPSNFLYNNEKGFGIVDYGAQSGKFVGERTAAEQIIRLETMLRYRPSRESDPRYDSEEYEKFSYEHNTGTVKILNRFLDILEKYYPEVLAGARQVQEKRNADPRSGHNSVIVSTANFRLGDSLLDEFRARLVRLGLAGDDDIELHDTGEIKDRWYS